MQDATTHTDTDLIATLNDLLELDHDAVNAYTLAIESLENAQWRADLIEFRGDHERHVRDLRALIEARGGEPADHAHFPTGVFKAAVQAASAAGGDREVLLAFKSNERQVRDKYARIADQEHPADVAGVLRRNARDEERHYTWVTDILTRLGAGPDSAIGKAEGAFEQVHGGAATMMEGTERAVRKAGDGGSKKTALLATAAAGVAAYTLTRMLR